MHDNAKFENRPCVVVEHSQFFTRGIVKNGLLQDTLLKGRATVHRLYKFRIVLDVNIIEISASDDIRFIWISVDCF